MARAALVVGASIIIGAGGVLAVDRPIDADKLVLRQTNAGVRVIFVTRDQSFLFPAIGSVDDPVNGTPGGAVVEIFSKTEGVFPAAAPAGSGDPGWTARDGGSFDAHRYRNRGGSGARLRTLIARQGRVMKVRVEDAGLAMSSKQDSVGIRITFGSTRSCALFSGTGVRRDQAGLFVGRGGVAGALGDCSDNALLDLPPACGDTAFPTCDGACPAGSVCSSQDLTTCTCIPDTDPCGSTFPTCNGECPVGEECANIGGSPLNNCGCIPSGQTACGTNECGGVCPTGQECNYFEVGDPQNFAGCLCGPPGPCGSGGDDCPVGFFCGVQGGFGQCFPRLCVGGTYPSCGGSCPLGDTCMPFGAVGTFLGCVCAPAGLPCESTCALGMSCPSGEACLSDGGICGCAPF